MVKKERGIGLEGTHVVYKDTKNQYEVVLLRLGKEVYRKSITKESIIQLEGISILNCWKSVLVDAEHLVENGNTPVNENELEESLTWLLNLYDYQEKQGLTVVSEVKDRLHKVDNLDDLSSICKDKGHDWDMYVVSTRMGYTSNDLEQAGYCLRCGYDTHAEYSTTQQQNKGGNNG